MTSSATVTECCLCALLFSYAVGPAIWAGTTIVVSFVWGVTLLGDHPKSISMSVVAIGILVVGIVIAALCNSSLPDYIYLRCLKPGAVLALLSVCLSTHVCLPYFLKQMPGICFTFILIPLAAN